MYKNIVLGLITASAVIMACATLYMASSIASMKSEVSGIREDLKRNDPMQVIAKWEEMKKTAQKEQSGLKPGEPVEGFSPINSSGNKETREPGSWFHTESHTGT